MSFNHLHKCSTQLFLTSFLGLAASIKLLKSALQVCPSYFLPPPALDKINGNLELGANNALPPLALTILLEPL